MALAVKLFIADCVGQECKEKMNVEQIGSNWDAGKLLVSRLAQSFHSRYPQTNRWAIFTSDRKGNIIEYNQHNDKSLWDFAEYSIAFVDAFKRNASFTQRLKRIWKSILRGEIW